MKAIRSLPANVRALCLAGFVEGLIAIGPLWALYVDELRGSVAVLGLLLSLSSLCMSVLQVPGGMISDRIGRRKAIIAGEIIRIVSLVAVGCAPRWEWLVPTIILSNAAGALINPARSALLAESVTADRRGRTFGLVDTIYAMTMIIGPALGLWIAGRMSIRIVFFLSAMLAAFSLAISIRWLEDKAPLDRPRAGETDWMAVLRRQFAFSRNRDLNILLASQGLSMIAASFAAPFFTLFAVNDLAIRKEQLAVIFMLNNALLMITRVPMGHLADHAAIPRKHLLAWGCVWGGLVWIVIGNSHSYAHLFFYALIALAFVLPARSALISDMTSARERASVFGTLSAVDGVFGAIGYAIAGVFANAYGLRLAFHVAGIGLLLSALFVTIFFHERRGVRVTDEEKA